MFTVAIRTIKERESQLYELIISLAAQKDQTFFTVVAADTNESKINIEKKIAFLPQDFIARIKIIRSKKSRLTKIEDIIKNTRTDKVVFLDDDDSVTDEYTLIFNQALEKLSDKLLIPRQQSYNRIYKYPISLSTINKIKPKLEGELSYFIENNTPFGSILLPVHLLKQINFQILQSEEFEDWYIIKKLLLLNYKFYDIHKSGYIVNQNIKSKKYHNVWHGVNEKKLLLEYLENNSSAEEISDLIISLRDQRSIYADTAYRLKNEKDALVNDIKIIFSEKAYRLGLNIRKITKVFRSNAR